MLTIHVYRSCVRVYFIFVCGISRKHTDHHLRNNFYIILGKKKKKKKKLVINSC